MSEEREHRDEGQDVMMSRYVKVVWRWRWVVVGIVVAALGTAVVVTAISPRVYDATAAIVVSKESGTSGALGNLAALGLVQQFAGLSLPSLTPNRDLLVSVLKSRTMAEAVANRFGLQQKYQSRFPDDAITRLRAATFVAVSKEGVITVKVEDTDARLAADMANFYIKELDRSIGRFSTGEAGRQREFLMLQVSKTRASLDEAEQRLRQFQESNRAVVLQEQTRGAIEAAARLKGEMMASQVQLEVVRGFATDANPEVVSLKRRIEELGRQLSHMQYGDGAARARDFEVPFARVPEVGLELARLMRNVKVQETLLTLLTQHLEQARLTEARDMPSVQVLDAAVPAVRPSRPRRLMNLASGGVAGLLVAVVVAVGLDSIAQARARRRRAAA